MSNSWTDEEQEQLRAAFNEHEPGTNGRINRSKLDELLVYVGQEPASDAALQELLRAHEDGANFDEFMDLMTQRAQQDDELSRGELLKAFEFFDKERKGFIPDAELRNVLRFLGNKLSAQEAEELIYLSPGTGCLDYHKFIEQLLGPADAGAQAL